MASDFYLYEVRPMLKIYFGANVSKLLPPVVFEFGTNEQSSFALRRWPLLIHSSENELLTLIFGIEFGVFIVSSESERTYIGSVLGGKGFHFFSRLQ